MKKSLSTNSHWRKGNIMAPFVFSVVLIINSTLWSTVHGAELNPPQAQQEELFLKEYPELKKFFTLIKEHPLLRASFDFYPGTLYAPTDDAINEYTRLTQKQLANQTLLYHYTNVPKWSHQLEDSVTTDAPGNSPVWITRKNGEIFLNEARIRRRDLLVKIGYSGAQQIVHMIDKVMQPTLPIVSDATGLNNPDAKLYLENSGSYQPFYHNNQRISISDFAAKVTKLKRLGSFKIKGRNTFFIPVNEAFKDQAKIGNVDDKVISGHIVIGHTIFLNSADTTQQYETFETAAGPNNFPVWVTLERNGDNWQVISDNRIESATANHQKGKVVAQIIKGNIPVVNGVIHFISKPLVIINSNLYDVLAGDDEAGLMHGFLKLLKDKDAVGNFNIIPQLEHLDERRRLTIFVPTTEAIESSTLLAQARGSRNHTAIKEIIQLHIVEQYLPENVIVQTPPPFVVESQLKDRKIYFHVVRNQTKTTLLLEGGGTIATVLHSDIGAKNGVIHIIDRVLGVEHQTIYEKLKTDPLLNYTYQLTNQDGYNEMFNDTKRRWTLFAPTNAAWQLIQREFPSEYLKLEVGRFGYQVGKIMNRHIIVDQALTMEDLYNVSLGSPYHKEHREQIIQRYPIPTLTREGIRVADRFEPNIEQIRDEYGPERTWRKQSTTTGGDYKYMLFWKRKESFVVRGNVKCTNGVIHFIDSVLMQPNDVYVNSARSITTSSISILLWLAGSVTTLVISRLLVD